MNEQEYIQAFLQVFTDIRAELKVIADELHDLNASLVQVEGVDHD